MSRGDALIAQYAEIHRTKTYGRSSEILTGFVMRDMGEPTPRRVLDYGCGRSRLVDWIAAITGAEAQRYDPAIPEFAAMPRGRFDWALCTDVMEHIPEEDVAPLLARLRSLAPKAYFHISCRPADEILPSGENAHVTVRPPPWWRGRLAAHWTDVRRVRSPEPTAASFVATA